jgi:hypothetical protein
MLTQRRVFGGSLLGALCLVLATVAPAHAQEEPPYDPAIDLQLFQYAMGNKTFLTVDDADPVWKGQYTFDLLMTFLTKPFTVFNADPNMEELIGERTNVVESMLAGEILGAYGLTRDLQIGVALPMILAMSGEGLSPIDAMPSPEGLQITGLGDLRVEAKMRVWQRDRLRLSGIGGVTIPTSFGAGGNEFLGDDLPSVRGRAAAQWTGPAGNLSLGATAGVLFRKPREIYSSNIGQQITYGVAASLRGNDRLHVVGEMFGRAGLGKLDLDASPLELSGAVRVRVTDAIHMMVGGGGGLVRGIGAPEVRMFVSVGWARDNRDSDGDGIPNYRDKCPFEPEDFDGWEDEDGCPDPDNDGDLRPDVVDQCPNDPEDLDGWEDEDGCPDPDNDGDGILDADDRCPNHPEDGLPPHPSDGCPASMRDSDGDGIMDDVDLCPLEPEDLDGFEDADGCPDPDNDGDGVPDEVDRCPLCKGSPDNDGCPVFGGTSDIARLDGDRLTVDRDITFDRRDQLTADGAAIVDEVAGEMKSHLEVTTWLLVVSAPKQRTEARTQDKSQRQAEAIRARLLAAGLADDRLEILAAAADIPGVGFIVRARTDLDISDPAMCPAHLRAVPNPRTR